jgi:uncharacterized protein YhaN
MIINGLSIDGFGVFHDTEVRDLPAGLSLFVGNNEAGKSTTMAFVNTVLFGYPVGRKDNAYPPLQGGEAGGRLLLTTQTDGDLTVERRQGTKGGRVEVRFEDGRSEGQSSLTRIMGGVNRSLFQKLYGFNLYELEKVASLTDDSVSDLIYGASLGTTTNSLPEIRRRLAGWKGELFKGKGQKQKINSLLGELEGVREGLREARRGIAAYERLATELSDLEDQVQISRERLHQSRARARRIEAHQQLWDDWAALQDTERRLSELSDEIEDFPADGLACMEVLIQMIAAEDTGLRTEKEDLEEKNSRLQNIKYDSKLLSQESEVRSLVRGLGAYEQSISDLPGEREHLKAVRRKATEVLEEVGMGRDEQWVLSLDRSSTALGEVEDHQVLIEDMKQQTAKTQEVLHEVEKEHDSLLGSLKKARERVEELKIGLTEGVPKSVMAGLRERRTQFQDVLRDLPGVETQRHEAQQELGDALREISPLWTTETAEQFDASLSSRERVVNCDDRRTECATRVRAASDRLHQAKETVTAAEATVESRTKALEAATAEATSQEVLLEEKSVIRELREAVHQRDVLAGELRLRQQMTTGFGSGSTHATAVTLGRRAQILAGVISMLGLLGGAFLWSQALPVIGAAAAGGLLLVAVIVLLLGRSVTGSEPVSNADVSGELERNLVRQAADFDRQAAIVVALQEKIGTSGEVTSDVVDELEDRNARRLDAAADLDRLGREIEESEEALLRSTDQRESAGDALEKERVEEAALQDEWAGIVEVLQLPLGTSARTALEVFSRTETARGFMRQLANYDGRLTNMREAKQRYLELMSEVAALAEVAATGDEDEQLKILTEFLADMDRQEDQRRLLAEATREASRAERALEAATAEKEESKAEEEGAIANQLAAETAWKSWLAAREMEESWSPDTVIRLLERASRLAELGADRDEVAERVERLVADQQAFETRLLSLCREVGRPEPAADKLVVDVHSLETDLAGALEQSALHRALSEEIPELENRCTRRLRHREELEAEKSALLVKGQARDEEDFKMRGLLHHDRQELLELLQTHQDNVRKIAGETDLVALREALEGESLPSLRVAAEEAEEAVNEAEKELDGLQEAWTRGDEQRRQLQGEDHIARMRAQEESLLESFRELSGKWARHAVALHLLSAAKDRFEQSHQPEVIRLAGGYFSRITGGKYRQVFAPHGEQTVEVVDDRERHVPVESLSRGTSEQLYLAIRFGYIASQDENREPLPLLMDDVMVNFDPTRAGQAAGGILEMAKTHQVMFFTCHPGVVEVFQNQDANVPVYRIGDGEIERAA